MSKRGENIYKRKDGRWEGRYIKFYSSSGKAKYGYVYAKTYREVKRKLSDSKAMIKTISITEPDMTVAKECFDQTAQLWLESKLPNIKSSSANKYKNLLNLYILPVYSEMITADLTTDFIQTYCNTLSSTGGRKRNGLSNKTVSDVLTVIREILKHYSIRGGILICNPQGIRIKKVTSEIQVLSLSEQKALCDHIYKNMNQCNLGILLCLFTGLRVGELCALQWEDFSYEDNKISVHSTMQRIQAEQKNPKEPKTKIIVTSPKSAASIREIPLPTELINFIKASSNVNNSGYFLTGSSKKFIEPRTMQNHFKKVLRDAHMEYVNFHTLRHTFATRCVELGFDVKSLSEILGHSSVTITMNRYVHPSMAHKADNMQRLSSLLAVK